MGELQFFASGGYEILSIAKPVASKAGKQILRKASALLEYHFKIDPDKLTDEEFSEKWQRLRWVLDFESQRFSLSEDQKTIKI